MEPFVPFKGHVNQVVQLQQSLVMEEGDSSVFDVPRIFEMIVWATLQQTLKVSLPGHKDDLAGVEKVFREKLKRQVGLDQPRRRHQVQSSKEPISLTKINSKATKMPRYCKV